MERTAREHGIALRGTRCAGDDCGFAAGCNALAAAMTADQLLLLNPDASVRAWPRGLAAASRVVDALVHDADGQPLHVSARSRTLATR